MIDIHTTYIKRVCKSRLVLRILQPLQCDVEYAFFYRHIYYVIIVVTAK
jgi:hypothetical protein